MSEKENSFVSEASSFPRRREPNPIKRGEAAFYLGCALLVYCVAAYADPFAPVPAAPASEAESLRAVPSAISPVAPLAGYRVAGVVVSAQSSVVVVQTPDGRFRVAAPGERVGGATVMGIALDAIEFRTGVGIARLVVGD